MAHSPISKHLFSRVDDVAILAWGATTMETCSKLQEALQAAEQWARTHASVFSPSKLQLTHYTRASTRIDTQQPLSTAWGEIPAKPTCKYLGLIKTLGEKRRVMS
jgi:hypothetical protein